MQITNVTTHAQTSDDLSPERIGRITGSAVGAILGLSKWQKPDDVMRSMVRALFDAPSEFTGNIATEWGNDHEDEAIEHYEHYFEKLNVEKMPFYAGDLEGMKVGASPDAHDEDDDCLLEVKCPFGKRNEKPNAAQHLAEHPDYEAQMQWQMICTNKLLTRFIVWTNKGADWVDVPRNEFWLLANIEKIKAFWDDFVHLTKHPELCEQYLNDKDGGYVIRTDDAFLDIADDYLTITKQIKALEKQQEEIKKKLLEVNGKQKSKGGGVTIFSSEKKGNVDYKKVPELVGVDLEPYRKKGSTTWTVKCEGDSDE